MTAVRVPRGTRAPAVSVRDVVDGRPWTARLIRNKNLRQHCRIMGRVFAKDTSLSGAFRPVFLQLAPVLAERSCILTGYHPNEMQVVPALLRLCAYATRWKREPADWIPPAECTTPRAQWEHFVQYLLASWPMPRFFVSAWETFGDMRHLERDWYCHAAEGKSMRRAEGMPRTATSRAVHLMMQAPDDLTVRQALRWGQATAAGCSDALRDAVIASSMVHDLSHDFIWSRLIQKAATVDAQPAAWDLLADGMRLCIRRDGYRQAARLLDVPWSKLLQHCRSQFYSLYENFRTDGMGYRLEQLNNTSLRAELCAMSLTTWPPLLTADSASPLPDPRGGRWICRELTNLGQLAAEGLNMHHCVVWYRHRCQSGRTAIFSLRRGFSHCPPEDYRRVLTIEVERETRTIVQVKGRWNRHPAPFERMAVRMWARANGLRW